MQINTFELERVQSLFENKVAYNLTESGVHPYSLSELVSPDVLAHLLKLPLTYSQTNGPDFLRATIAQLYPDANLNQEQILVTNGSSEANYVAMKSLLDAGDEVVIMMPNYMEIWGIVAHLGCTLKPFYLHESHNWGPDLDEIRELISPKTKMIVICNPNNPTGAVLSSELMEELVTLAASVGAWLYADEVYRGAELNEQECKSFMGMYDRVVVSGGLSKAYALPGLRIGWLAGPQKLIENAWAYHDYTSITAGILSHHVAGYALQHAKRQQILARNRAMLRENLEVLQAWIAKQSVQFHFVPPKAGGMAFMRYDIAANSTELSDYLRKNKDVFVVSGDCFGMDQFLRLGIGAERNYLEKGLKLIEEGITMWREAHGV